MNEKEVAEIRRRFRADRSAITHIRGCYVNEAKEIVSRFDQSLAMMTPEETEKLLALLRRTLSGSLGKNLMDITFATRQVVEGEEHRLLMALRNSRLTDEEAIQTLFQRVIQSLELEGSYLILLAHDAYDVPYRGGDGEELEDGSDQVFSYILCSVCPVKQTKPALSYYVHENAFHSLTANWVISPPEVGFLFPAFDDRSTNLYGALYYCRDTGDNHQAFVDAVFRTPPPMAPDTQKEVFHTVLADSLGEDCSLEVVQALHGQFSQLMAEHKASKVPEPLTVSRHTVRGVLSSCGLEETRMSAFDQGFDRQFGQDTDLSPRNLIDPRQLELRTPDVTIKVSGDRSDLVQTRVINGTRYILIRADEGAEVNGVAIQNWGGDLS